MKPVAKPLVLYISAILCLGGCAMAPKYNRPQAPVPSAWPQGEAYKEASGDSSARSAADIPWQDFFVDEKLRKLVALALENNRDLRVAVLNIEKSRAQYRIKLADLLPKIDAEGSATYQRLAEDFSGLGIPMNIHQYNVGLAMSSYELDLFGRVRSLKDQALEQYFATDEARRSAWILLVSSTAQAYLLLAADRDTLETAAATLESQEAARRLIRKQYDLGIASELDLKRAETQVESARVEVARWTQVTAQDINALTLLAGVSLPEDLLPTGLAGVAGPREPSAGLSSEILLRRPDILAAEHLLKASNANIGAARAAFFPRISLTATVGTASADLSDLFKGGQGVWSFVPRIAVPIFDARTWAAYEVTKADRDIAIAEYEKAIQEAFREVADALAVRGSVEKQIASQDALVEAVAQTYRLSRIRYNSGLDSYLSVLDAQRSLYGAQQKLTSLRLLRVANRVTLYQVLGGGIGEERR